MLIDSMLIGSMLYWFYALVILYALTVLYALYAHYNVTLTYLSIYL